MIFSTYKFIFLFLPAIFATYWILNYLKCQTLAKFSLVIASLYFYSRGSLSFFPYFIISIFGNYFFGNMLASLDDENKKTIIQKKILLVIGILANVALLGYYKYYDFFIENVNVIFKTSFELRHIALPIGISFFTFQLIAFLVDTYKGQTKDYSMLNYLLFITFFPQLIVGPIVHHGEVVPQFESEERKFLNAENLKKGILLFVIGCTKKLLLADPLTENAQQFFDGISRDMTPGFLQAWYYSLEYTISYYFDLSGYADMAIGLGFMFNIEIPENFNSPYKARNFQDYWRRWHMTLSHFLSDYIFKSVFRKGNKIRNYYVATMVTFLVSGFWHGAGWSFVLWGILNGFFVCTASFMKRKNLKFPAFIAYPLTMLGVIALRGLFVSDSLLTGFSLYKGMLNFKNLLEVPLMQQVMEFGNKKLLIIAMLICWFTPTSKTIVEKYKSNKIVVALAGVAFAICILSMNKVAAFLYFQF